MTPVAFDPKAVRLLREWKAGSPLTACRFDPTGRFLFAAGQDETIRRLDLDSGATAKFAGHRSWVRGIAFLPVGSKPTPTPNLPAAAVVGSPAVPLAAPAPPFTVVSGDYHGRLLWWRGDVPNPTVFREVQAHDGWLRWVAVSPNGKTVATCGNDKLVKLWSADGAPVRTLAGHDSHVYAVAFHPTANRLVSADLMGHVKDWDLGTGKVAREFDAKVMHWYDPTFRADIGGARGIAFAPDGSRFVICGITNVSNAFAGVGNPLVVSFAWADGKPTLLKPKEAFQGTAWGVGVHPAGWVVAGGGGSGGRVWVWPGADPASAHTVTLPAHARDFALAPDGSRFAVAGANGTASVYALGPPPA